jgi:hypothetical protein
MDLPPALKNVESEFASGRDIAQQTIRTEVVRKVKVGAMIPVQIGGPERECPSV